MAIDLSGQTALITGAARGLGEAYARALASRGARVVLNDLGQASDGTGANPELDAVADAITEAGGKAAATTGDVCDPKQMQALVDQASKATGRIDILINNAGILRDKSFAKMDFAQFSEVVDVHLIGSARLSHLVWPLMQDNGYGRIVMATSSSGLYGNFGQANYAAAKLGLMGLMMTLGIEGQKRDIRVNAIAPVAHTQMTEGLFPGDAAKMMPPHAVAEGVVFLSGPDAPNRCALCAGGGVFSVSQIVETQGAALGVDATADDLAAHFEAVRDPSRAQSFGSGPDQTVKFFNMAASRAKN